MAAARKKRKSGKSENTVRQQGRAVDSDLEPRLQPPRIEYRVWSRGLRWFVSAVLLYHVAAMFISPWAVPPSSVIANGLQPWVAHYQTLLYLNHGYRFFAPNPGPATIVLYTLEFEDGRQEEGLFPDRQAINRDYPRLMYHRWFMLSESIGRFLGEQVTEAEFQQFQADERARADQMEMAGQAQAAQLLREAITTQDQMWEEATRIRRRLLTPLAHRLLLDHEATRVSIRINQRGIPSPQQFREGWRTDDPRLMTPATEIPMGTWTREEFQSGSPETAPPSAEGGEESLPQPLSQWRKDSGRHLS